MINYSTKYKFHSSIFNVVTIHLDNSLNFSLEIFICDTQLFLGYFDPFTLKGLLQSINIRMRKWTNRSLPPITTKQKSSKNSNQAMKNATLKIVKNDVCTSPEFFSRCGMVHHVVGRWEDDICNISKKSFTFQQDGATSHTSRKTRNWCRRHFPRFWSKEMWHPTSPDLYSLDIFEWSLLEAKVCSISHINVKALKQSFQSEWAKISQK